MSTEGIAKALGRIVGGCAIVTAKSGGKSNGLLASWIQQAGMEPPMVSVAIKKGRPIEGIIDAAGSFGINILGEHAEAMMKHFSKGFGPEDNAFAGLKTCECGGAVAIDDRIAFLSAVVHGKYDAGDHWIYVGKVTGGDGDDTKKPYLHIRKQGLSY